MVVYIEYAFLENFLLDGLLLYFSLRYSGVKRSWRWLFSAILGAVGALTYSLLSLPLALSILYKIALGIFLPIVAAWKAPPPQVRLTVLFFFAFSFFVAGGTFAFVTFLPIEEGYYLQTLPVSTIIGVFLALVCLLAETVVKAKKRRLIEEFFVDCLLEEGEERVRVKGFIDTGNRARHKRKPICFVPPNLYLRFVGAEKEGGAKIKTMTGEKKIPLIKIHRLRIRSGGQTHIIDGVYLASSVALCGREYELLLGAWALE